MTTGRLGTTRDVSRDRAPSDPAAGADPPGYTATPSGKPPPLSAPRRRQRKIQDALLYSKSSIRFDLGEVSDINVMALTAGLTASGKVPVEFDEYAQEAQVILKTKHHRSRIEMTASLVWFVQVMLANLGLIGLVDDAGQPFLSAYRPGNWTMWGQGILLLVVTAFVLADVAQTVTFGGRDTPQRRFLSVSLGDKVSKRVLLRIDLALHFVGFALAWSLIQVVNGLMISGLYSSVWFVCILTMYRNLCDAYEIVMNSILVWLSYMVMSQSDTMIEMLMDFLAVLFILEIDGWFLFAARNGIFGWRTQKMFLELKGNVKIPRQAPVWVLEVGFTFFLCVLFISWWYLTTSAIGTVSRETWILTEHNECLICPERMEPLRLSKMYEIFLPKTGGECEALTSTFFVGNRPYNLYIDYGDKDAEGNASDIVFYATPTPPDEGISGYRLFHILVRPWRTCSELEEVVTLLRLPRRTDGHIARHAKEVGFDLAWRFTQNGIEEFDFEIFPPDCPAKIEYSIPAIPEDKQFSHLTTKPSDCWEDLPISEIIIRLEGKETLLSSVSSVVDTEEFQARSSLVPIFSFFVASFTFGTIVLLFFLVRQKDKCGVHAWYLTPMAVDDMQDDDARTLSRDDSDGSDDDDDDDSDDSAHGRPLL